MEPDQSQQQQHQQNELQKKIDHLEGKIEEVQKEIRAKDNKIEEVQKEIRAKDSKIEGYLTKLAVEGLEQQEKDRWDGLINVANDQIQALIDDKRTLNDQIRSLKGDKKRLNDRIASLTQQQPEEEEEKKGSCGCSVFFEWAGCAARGNPHRLWTGVNLLCYCCLFWYFKLPEFGVHGNGIWDGCRVLSFFVAAKLTEYFFPAPEKGKTGVTTESKTHKWFNGILTTICGITVLAVIIQNQANDIGITPPSKN